MIPASSHETPVDAKKEAFKFVQALAGELSKGKIELPSFPEVAMRIQRMLTDENVAADKIVRAIGAEPALAVRVLRMANSAALNLSGKQVTELRTAVARLGFNLLRSAAYSFIVAQVRQAANLRKMDRQLLALWEQSSTVAAICFVVARKYTQVNADSALLAGLLHGVGKLYILTRATNFPGLLSDPESYAQVESEWHANIARALLENWEIAEDIVTAVQEYEEYDRETRGPANVGDVLTAATLLAEAQATGDIGTLRIDGVKAWQRLGIDRAGCEDILRESSNEIAALRGALGS